MAPKYKLYYFEYTGVAEPIRYIFAYADQQYEDIRIKTDKWPEIKKTTKYGKLPLIEIDGKTTSDSGAILRHLAKKFNLTGDNDEDAFQCDSLFGSFKDLQQIMNKLFYEKDPAKIEEIKQKLVEINFPFYFKKWDDIIAKNGGFLVGKKITYVDLAFAASLSIYNDTYQGILKPYPALNGLVEKVNNLPNIKKWLQKRPPNGPI